jgi:predicted MFS family arabinose efflux permease
VIAASAVLTVAAALGFARFGYSMVLPGMKAGLSLTEVQAGDLATANMVGYLALSLLGGLLASRFGPRIVISISLVLVAAGMALTGISNSYGTALAARFMTGMASGGANVPVMGLLTAWFASRERGLAGGLAVSGSSLAILLAGFLVPGIAARYGAAGWRVSWFALAAMAAILALVCAISIRNGPARARPEGTDSRPGTRAPLSAIFSKPAMWALGIIYAFFGFSYIVYATFFVRYLCSEAGYSLERAGAYWSLIGGLSVASGFLWGSVSDRLGRRYALAIVFFLQALSFSVFGLWKSPAGIFVSCAFFALTAWSIPAIMAAAAGDLLGRRLAPGALGFLTVFMGLGQVLGPLAGGRIARASGSYSLAFVLAGALALAGAALSLFLKNKGPGSLREEP